MLPGGGKPCPLCQSRDGDPHFAHSPGVSSPELFLSGKSSVKEILGDPDEVHPQTLRAHGPGAECWGRVCPEAQVPQGHAY